MLLKIQIYISPEKKLVIYNNEIWKITNLLDNQPNQPSNLKTQNWTEINDNTRGTCKRNSKI